MSIDDEAGISAEQLADKIEPEETAGTGKLQESEVISRGGGFRLPEWFYIPRLDDPIEKYMGHPLNFGKSEGVAYILRGFSALASGILNYWWMDVVGGFLRLRKEAAAKVVTTEGGETI